MQLLSNIYDNKAHPRIRILHNQPFLLTLQNHIIRDSFIKEMIIRTCTYDAMMSSSFGVREGKEREKQSICSVL